MGTTFIVPRGHEQDIAVPRSRKTDSIPRPREDLTRHASKAIRRIPLMGIQRNEGMVSVDYLYEGYWILKICYERGRIDENNTGAEPLKSIFKKNGVDFVVTDTCVDSDFRVGNGSKQPECGSKSDLDSGTNGANRKHDGMHRHPTFASYFHGESSQKKVGGLSAIVTPLRTLVMLDSCIVTTCMRSWGCMDYAQAWVDIRVDRALKDTTVNSILNPIGNGVMMHTIKVEYEWKAFCGPLISKQRTGGNHSLPNQQMSKSAYQKKTTSTRVSNAFSSLEEDNRKPMDVLVDDTRKKVEAPPSKTGIWDDMKFDDMEHVVKEAEHGNASSENG
ncbi:hypothetical protein Tco_0535735 [Tanacetum coccineum]